TTFHLNETMFRAENLPLLIINGLLTLLFSYAAFWLFVNIRYENREQRWFKLIFEGKEWTPTLKAMELLEEIEGFREEVR
ncbi:MAG: hypothetical protein EAZ89_03685, partial [Bacteroidetes bacterium]